MTRKKTEGPRLRLATSVYAEDGRGNRVFLAGGDYISEIQDAGPETVRLDRNDIEHVTGWNVNFKLTPEHGLWTEIVIMDAVKLLKALEGKE